MGVVIDTSCLAKVLDQKNSQHVRFAPVWAWVSTGKGKMVYGGTKYLAELDNMRRYWGIVAELRRQGRVLVLPKDQVDQIAMEVKSRIVEKEFNDEHLVAIVVKSKCRIVCTDDLRAIPFLKRNAVYRFYGAQRPKIYTQEQHANLCCDRNLPPDPNLRKPGVARGRR
jgi:hypothetical protein